MTPFKALYEISPPQLALGPYQQTNIASVDSLLQERQRIDQQLRENLAQARARMKTYADKRRSERTFEEGDWLPIEDRNEDPRPTPAKELQTRLRGGKNSTGSQWLVQWSDSSVEDATWEDAEALQRAYPDIRLWG
ncbi:Uncharacterized protein Adt_22915 [Abeliophyllum distichum]|uniref:Chromo domain-containing protein n=1 Tax=Abeliophyllum distichum TaxID=126358 RepID=A0ABD1S9F4_9LAMI